MERRALLESTFPFVTGLGRILGHYLVFDVFFMVLDVTPGVSPKRQDISMWLTGRGLLYDLRISCRGFTLMNYISFPLNISINSVNMKKPGLRYTLVDSVLQLRLERVGRVRVKCEVVVDINHELTTELGCMQ